MPINGKDNQYLWTFAEEQGWSAESAGTYLTNFTCSDAIKTRRETNTGTLKYTHNVHTKSFQGPRTSHITLPLPELARAFPKTIALIQKERWGGC